MFDFFYKNDKSYHEIIDKTNVKKPLISWMADMTVKEKNKVCEELFTELKYYNTFKEIKYYDTLKEIKKILEDYDDEIIIDTVNMYAGDEIIMDILVDILPMTKIKTNIIINLVKVQTRIIKIESLVDRIDINAIDENGNICLRFAFDEKYLIELLSSTKLNFDVNLKNADGWTFYHKFLSENKGASHSDFNKIRNILLEKNYNFNVLYNSYSLLDVICIYGNCHFTAMKSLLSLESYDITSTILWIYYMIRFKRIGELIMLKNIVSNRPDKESFLNNIISKYTYASADSDILLLMNLIDNEMELNKMILYKNSEGNTIMHIACEYHLKRVIRFIAKDKKYTFEPNLSGKTPKDLYEENNIINLL